MNFFHYCNFPLVCLYVYFLSSLVYLSHLQQDYSRICMLLCISLCFFVRELRVIQTWWGGRSTIWWDWSSAPEVGRVEAQLQKLTGLKLHNQMGSRLTRSWWGWSSTIWWCWSSAPQAGWSCWSSTIWRFEAQLHKLIMGLRLHKLHLTVIKLQKREYISHSWRGLLFWLLHLGVHSLIPKVLELLFF